MNGNGVGQDKEEKVVPEEGFVSAPDGSIIVEEALDDIYGSDVEDDSLSDMADELHEGSLRDSLQEKLNVQHIKRALRKDSIYGKLYSISKSGDLTFYHTLPDIKAQINRIEEYLKGLIDDNETWPGGKWALVVRDEKARILLQHTFSFPEKTRRREGSDGSDIAKDAIQHNKELLRMMLEQSNSKSPMLEKAIETLMQKNSTEDLEKALTLAKAINPPKQGNNELLITLITVGLPIVAEIFKSMRSDRKEPTLIEQAQALKLMHDINSEKPQDSFNSALGMFSQVAEIIGSMDKSSDSPLTAALKHIGPHVGEVLGSASKAFADIVALKREQLALGHGVVPGRRQIAGPDATSQERPSEGSQTEMNPLTKRIYVAVMNNDAGFYDDLESIIKTFMGKQQYEDILSGTITIEAFVNYIAKNFPEFSNPEAMQSMVAYMEGFVIAKLDERQDTSVTAVCPACKSSFVYDTPEEFDADSKVCGTNGCSGMLMLSDERSEEQVEKTEEQQAQASGG